MSDIVERLGSLEYLCISTSDRKTFADAIATIANLRAEVAAHEGFVRVLESRIASLTQRLKELDPDPVVCGCREAGCQHQPIAQLPRAELVKHYKAIIEDQHAEVAALETLRAAEHTLMDAAKAAIASLTQEIEDWKVTVENVRLEHE